MHNQTADKASFIPSLAEELRSCDVSSCFVERANIDSIQLTPLKEISNNWKDANSFTTKNPQSIMDPVTMIQEANSQNLIARNNFNFNSPLHNPPV